MEVRGINDQEQKIDRYISEMANEIAVFLQNMVRADSCNPPGDTRETVDVIARALSGSGIEFDRHLFGECHESIVATINPGRKPNLLFNSHIDTVPVGDLQRWKHSPHSGEIEAGRLYGRGAADAKASVAAMVMAALAIVRCGIKLKGSLTINPAADEELGGDRGVKYLIDSGALKPDLVVIGEITGNNVAIAHKGFIWFKVISRGRTAHGSTPWDGINAISKMVRFLCLLEKRLEVSFSQKSHPLTPPPTLNIGLIEGGVKGNVVADHCTAVLDRRILPNETYEEAMAEIEAVIETVKHEDPEADLSTELISYGAPLQTDPGEELVRVATNLCSEFGLSGSPVEYRQSTDGRYFSAAGIPTILLGPGEPETAHAPNESIAVSDVVEAARLYALLAMRALDVKVR